MVDNQIIIIGAGIAGLGAAYALRQEGIEALVLEQGKTWGGLCGNFETLPGFRFDRFVHLSFSDNPQVSEIFVRSTDGHINRHIPNPFNIYNRKWIKHPAQNNLFPLADEEKRQIIEDFKKRPEKIDIEKIENYEQWLRLQYGNTFAERFPMQYTPKYWMHEAAELETRWVGNRMYQPSLAEVEKGAKTDDTPVTYYAREMRYPKQGGFKSFLTELAREARINYGEKVIKINPEAKTIDTSSGKTYHYLRLISSMPLPELIRVLGKSVPEHIKEAARKLKCTSGYIISIALKGESIPPYLWWYIYDRDILPARVYSPSLKSRDNAPDGCSSLQLEVYCRENEYTDLELYDRSVLPLIEMGAISKEDILDVNIRFEPWANVVFDHNIYEAREEVLTYVRALGIEPIGRFGLWEYLWTDQALLTGLRIARNNSELKKVFEK